jgi:hypothetical protein
MTEENEPLVRLEPGGKAPILSYNLPEPAIYFGKNFIELEHDADVFTDVAWERPDTPELDPTPPAEDKEAEEDDKDESVDPAPVDPSPPDEPERPQPSPSPPSDGDVEDPRFPRKPAPPHDGEDGDIHPLDASETDRPRERTRVRDHRRRLDVKELSDDVLEREVKRSMKGGFADTHILPNARVKSGKLRFREKSALQLETDLPVSDALQSLDIEEVVAAKQQGKELSLYSSMYGTVQRRIIERAREVQPTFLLVETYRLASYLGSYGAGRVIQTFSLLPGERTTISVKTFRKTEEERKQTSSILDSFTEESATDFERTIETEQSDKETYEKSFEYHSEAEANASWGWGKARASGGVKGGTNAAREEFAKNSTSAVDKHTQKSSAKREVEVDTSYEAREVEKEERSTEREIENINLSRTLNFVFRQMNQEFITLLSLVDVRVAFFNGFAESRKEVTLPELDSLLETYVTDDHRDAVRTQIRDSLGSILDYEGQVHDDFIEEREIDDDNRYLRVRSEKTSTYEDPVTDTAIEVPGIIVSATTNSMRTDGILVEALLGTSGALDQYADRLQELEVTRIEGEIAKESEVADRIALGNEIVRDGDEARIELLTKLLRNGSTASEKSETENQTDTKDRDTGGTDPAVRGE